VKKKNTEKPSILAKDRKCSRRKLKQVKGSSRNSLFLLKEGVPTENIPEIIGLGDSS